MRIRCLLLAAVGVACAQPAAASEIYTLQASGQVTDIFGGPGTFTSDGRISVGDAFSAKFTIDESSIVSTVTTVGSDSQAVYTIPGSYTFSWGSYTASGPLGALYLIINDNHDIGAGLIEDSIGFVGFLPATTDTPFALSTPIVYPSFQADAFDTTHTTLDGVGLDQLVKFASFPRQFAELAFVNATFDSSVIARANITTATFSADVTSVPEAATWAMMVLGFGIVGAGARRQTRTTAGVGRGQSVRSQRVAIGVPSS